MGEATDESEYLEAYLDKFVFRVRRGYLYTAEDHWLAPVDGRVRVGVTDFLQRLSGDVAFVKLARTGCGLEKGDDLAEVETIKTTLVVAAPVAGTLVEANEALTDQPELLNEDPYGEGWLALLEPVEKLSTQELLDAEAYFSLMKGKLAEEERKRQAQGG